MDVAEVRDAQPGDVVHVQVSRRGRRGGWSFWSKTHLATVDHRYGSGANLLWVRPLCGAGPGRAESGSEIADEQCARCRAIGSRTEEKP